ncbi:MAG: hypothetical protein J0M29_09770 [Chitinophagales bacterium]|nr:hypothetical protein [Chitinophagales bacterium]
MSVFSRIPAKYHLWLGALATALLLFFLAKPIFKDYFTQPNSMMYSFGGDALMLYYNPAYHTRYDDGSTLRSMGYPDGEYIYLTDAQGSLSNVMQWVHRHVTDLSYDTVGWVNGFNLYLLFAAVIFVFLLLRAFKVHMATAILLAPMIVLLSPQIRRMGGHFGLAYPFLIPLAMLWFVRKYRVGVLEKRDALMLLVSLFFTFNNPYVGFNINFFLILAGLVMFAAGGFKRSNWKTPAIIAGMGLLSLGMVFLDFKLFDPVHDRLNPQWGFFFYHATFEGLFHPPDSILYQWLVRNKIMVSEVEFEAMLNVGMVTTLCLAVMLLLALAGIFLRKNKPALQKLLPENRILLGASLLLFLLAANTSILPVSEPWLEKNMGWMLMFKASGRLGWTAYFALTITAAVFIDRLFRVTSPNYMAAVFLISVVSLWNAEINQYIRPKFSEVFNENFFDRQHEEEILNILKENKVNPAEYQAMMSVPKMISWSDKVLSRINYRTQMSSVRISLATGLPMVNSMLSRIGLNHSLERVQMLSNPLIERTLVSRFPNQKDILLVVGSDALPELKGGEKYMVDISEKVATSKDFSLFRLKVADINNNAALLAARAAFQSGNQPSPTFHLGFEDQSGQPAFYGKGSLEVPKGEASVAEWVNSFPRDTVMNFSAWTYVDARLRGPGFWMLSVRDASGGEVEPIKLETRLSNDVQNSWMRSEAKFWIPQGGKVTIKTFGYKPMLVDEVMLWPKGMSPVVYDGGEEFMFEGVRVRK